MAKKTKAVMGRPLHEATDGNKAIVKMFTAAGLSQNEIAKHLKIDRKTLAKHYEHELEVGWIEAIGDAATAIITEMKSTTSDKRLDAAKFFLSRRGRGLWSETKNVELSGKDGGAIAITNVDLDALAYEDLEMLDNILAPAIIEGEIVRASDADDDEPDEQD